MSTRTQNIRRWLGTEDARKLVLWFLLSLVLSFVFFRGFWSSLPAMLDPKWVFQFRAAPWGVLLLCLISLWLKRKRIKADAECKIRKAKSNFVFYSLNYIAGVGLVAGAIIMPRSEHFIVFQVLLIFLGIFVIIFKRGARIPAILLAVYGFSLAFPMALQRFAADTYYLGVMAPMMRLLTALGYPLQSQGQWINFTSASGEPQSYMVTIGCAGSETMGVFIALFVLMMLDRPRPPSKAVWLFFFGVVGTWFQSFIRLIILILVGYHLGSSALWTAHYWTVYILFPVWYLAYVLIYFRQSKRPPRSGEHELNLKLAIENKM